MRHDNRRTTANGKDKFPPGLRRKNYFFIPEPLDLSSNLSKANVNFGAFLRWNRFIDATKHPIQLKLDQEPTLLLSWLAVVEGENNWLPADCFSGKVRCDNGIRAGASRIAMTRPDLIEKMLKAKSIYVQTTGSDGKSWIAVFTPNGMRLPR